jgi:hypothetical protein
MWGWVSHATALFWTVVVVFLAHAPQPSGAARLFLTIGACLSFAGAAVGLLERWRSGDD